VKNGMPFDPTSDDALERVLVSTANTLLGVPPAALEILRRLQFVAELTAQSQVVIDGPLLLYRKADRLVDVRPIPDQLVVGRGADCDLSLPECRQLSRRHFELRREGDGFILSDLKSRNGTRVEGLSSPISRHILCDGDIIQAGDLMFVFLLAD